MVKFRLHSVYNFSSVNIYNYSGIAMGEGGGPPWAKVRKGSKNGVTTAKNDKNMGDKGSFTHLATWGQQNCSPPREPITHATPLNIYPQ